MSDVIYAWHARAACRNLPVNMFYLTDNESPNQLKKTCASCPVQLHCAIAGLAEDHGYWGGVAPQQRARWRQDLQLAAVVGMVRGDQARFDRFKPWLEKVFTDAKRVGIKSALVCNVAEPQRGVKWLKSLEWV